MPIKSMQFRYKLKIKNFVDDLNVNEIIIQTVEVGVGQEEEGRMPAKRRKVTLDQCSPTGNPLAYHRWWSTAPKIFLFFSLFLCILCILVYEQKKKVFLIFFKIEGGPRTIKSSLSGPWW